MKRFDFASVFGRSARVEDNQDDQDDGAAAEDDDAEAGAAAEDGGDSQDGGDGQDGDGAAAEDDEETPEEAAAFALGAAAERERIGTILSADHVNRDNLPAAIELALNTAVDPSAAAAVLGVTGSAIGSLAAAMAGEHPVIGQPGASRSGGPSTAELMKQRHARK